ncbi:MAG: hypothetical protein JWO05_1091 [Gemmatimonadetes bacterium]|nr:hypothetical protein [Gemmatimonadota bacterium]
MKSRAIVVASLVLLAGARLQGQVLPGSSATPGPMVAGPSIWQRLPVTASGAVQVSSELYRHSSGVDQRRPGASWRISMSPSLRLFNQVGMGTEVLLSSEGSQVRQSVDQVGLNPTYKWATFHIGDFARDYSSYTLQGTRLRGFGVDLKPGIFQFSVQGGQAQRVVAQGGDGAAYKRSMFGASLGIGRDGGNHFALTMLKAKDDPNSLSQHLVNIDTTFTDTALIADPLRFATSPQENLVVGMETDLGFFQNILHFTGQVGASLFTRDLRSQTVGDAGVGALGPVSTLQPLRLSTSGDKAMQGQIELRFQRFGIRGGYEDIGAGYTSLGLPYLINDRRGFNVGGNVNLFSNRISLAAETRAQANNLLGQKVARTDRNNSMMSAVFAITPSLMMANTVVLSTAGTTKSDAAPGLDMHTMAVTSTITNRMTVFARPTAISLTYAFQDSKDHEVGSVVPGSTGNNITASITTSVNQFVSAGPSLSIVNNSTGGQKGENNVLLGMTGRARLLAGQRLALTGNVSNTFSSGRSVRAMKADASYPVFWETKLAIGARHTAYSAFATKPAFNESFLTIGMTRSLTSR